MKIETTFQDDHQVKITAEVDAEQFEESKHRAARKLAKKVKIPGFRPGKAPYAVIVRQLGEGAVVEEALDMLVEDAYPKLIEEAGIKPYGPGTLEKISQMDPPILEFVVPLDAEIKLGDYRSLKKDYELPEVGEVEIQAVLNNLRQRQVLLEDVERPAQDGDLVTVKVSAKRSETESKAEEADEATDADAETEVDADAALIKERSFPILVQSEPVEGADSQRYEWPFSGFSKHLLGLSAGDETSFEYTYPEDAEQEGFRGVKALFNVEVEGIKSRLLPEIDDDFAKSVGEYDTMEELLNEIREMLEEQSQKAYDEEYLEALLEEGVELSEFKYPPQMLKRQLDDMIHNLDDRLQQQNMTMELYLKSRDMDMEALREETRPIAEKQLLKELFLMELADSEDLKIEQGLLMQEANNTMNYIASGMSEKEVKKLTNPSVYNNVITSVYANLITKAAMDRLRDIASGKLAEMEAAEATAKAEAEAQAQADTTKEAETETPNEATQAEAQVEAEAPETPVAEADAAEEEPVQDTE